MQLSNIPFASYIGITHDLQLKPTSMLKNHLDTLHAGAIYTLAESASGDALLKTFPTLKHKVIPLLRESTIKYKNPAYSNIAAQATINALEIEKFYLKFSQKGYALIQVFVIVVNEENQTICEAQFKLPHYEIF